MSQFLNSNVWVPVATVLVVLVTSGLIIILVRHLKRKRQQRYSIKRNSEAELVINNEIPYSDHVLPSSRLRSDTSEGQYEIYLFGQSE